MSFKSFKEIGYDLSEKEALAFEKRIIAAYKQALKDIEQKIKDQYAKYLAGIPKKNYYNEMLKHNRLEKLYLEIVERYSKAANLSKSSIIDASTIALSNNYYRQTYANLWLSEYSFSVLPESIIELSVTGSRKAWKEILKSNKNKLFGSPANYKPPYTLTQLLLEHKRVELNKIQTAIEQGLLNGYGVNKTAKSIREIIGSYLITDGKVNASGAMANSVRIIRTETNRALNDAAYAAQKNAEAMGIDIEKMWSSTLDTRTRPVHGALDGQIQPIDKPFKSSAGDVMRPGAFQDAGNNILCRCMTIDVIDGQSPEIRRGRNPVTGENEVFKYKSFKQWMDDNNLKYNKSGKIIS